MSIKGLFPGQYKDIYIIPKYKDIHIIPKYKDIYKDIYNKITEFIGLQCIT